MYLLGDCNIDLLNLDKHSLSSEFFEDFYTNFSYPIKNKPPSVSNNSATLIDNILSNNIIKNKLFVNLKLIFIQILPIIYRFFLLTLGGKLGHGGQYMNVWQNTP